MPVNKKGVHLSAEQRDRLAAAIGSYDGKDIAVSKLVAQTGLGIQAVRRGLHISGYSTGHGTRGLWVKMPTEAEKAEEARLQAELEENLGFHYAEPYTEIELAQQARDARLAAVDRELREAEAERQAGYARAAEHARMEETRRLDSAEVFARQDAPEYHDQLQFIDDRDSWTIPVPAKLIEKAKAMGLEIEVRVWKP